MSQKPEFFGKYILLDKIAVGGMAEVYLAKATGAENVAKFVAIKRILPQHSKNQDFVEMFKEEAKIAVNLSHGNIVPIYEFGEYNSQFYLAMEYVEGKNLRQIINRSKEMRKPMTVEQGLYIINEAARGLDHAHRCLDGNTGRPLNIIHRDISPQNLMISFEGEVKIVDFGIAKAESKVDSTKHGTLKGKFSYMSPEQADGIDIDFRTDIFSLGIVLWELLANDRLFSANNELNTLRKIRECQIPSLHKIDSKIPIELERICTKALARDRNLRYQSASEFQRDLNRFLNRHFPDYSSHEFSNSMKELFANEIVEGRRRLVDYAKIVAAPPPDDKTVLVDVTKTLTATEASQSQSNGPKLETVSTKSGPAQTKTVLAIVPSKPPPASTIIIKPLELQRRPQQQKSQHAPSPEKTESRRSSLGAILFFVFATIGLGYGFSYYDPDKFNEIRCLVFQDSACQKTLSSILVGSRPGETVELENVIVVMSTPSGAEILVEGQSTGVFTPGQVRVPVKNEINLALRKEGYLTKPVRLVAPKNGDSITLTLEKTNVGFVSVIVKPSSAAIYVNGQKLDRTPPIHRYEVPAGKLITVRAVDPVTGATAEKTVVVKENREEEIYLFMKKSEKRGAASEHF